MLLLLDLHCRDLRRSIFYQVAMETAGNVQLDGLQDQNLNVIWDLDGRDLSVKAWPCSQFGLVHSFPASSPQVVVANNPRVRSIRSSSRASPCFQQPKSP